MTSRIWLIGWVVLLGVAWVGPAAGAGGAADQWVERCDCQLVRERFSDGDSFGLEWRDADGKVVRRTYRLYGVDCPESDGDDRALGRRIEEQAAHWRVDREILLKAGKEAAEFTARRLRKGRVRILTKGKLGQEVPKQPGRPQRRYALVEVLDDHGKPRWLHELLLESGLARVHGQAAAWPPGEEDRHGREAAERAFMKRLERMEKPLRGK